MGMTIAEKILAHASRREEVKPNEIVVVGPDLVMSNDATTHITIDIFRKMGGVKVKSPDKIVFVVDHNVPSNSVQTAEVHKKMREFAKYNSIKLYDGEGVCHQLLIEHHAVPGTVIVGADSHTCTLGALGAFATGIGSTDMAAIWVRDKIWLKVPQTLKFEINGKLPDGVYAKDLILKIIGDIGADGATYKAMEFSGSTVKEMSMDSRFTLCNMAVEAGAKTGIIEPDEKIIEFLSKLRSGRGYRLFRSDSDAEYEKVYYYDASEIEPMIACPHTLDNVKPVREVEGLKIHEAFIGSCTNGRIEDLRIAAEILEGNKVHPDVRLIISPASRNVFRDALKEGLIETFLESGAIVMNPNCSTCWGACQGVLGDGERLISTGSRNFRGRAGSPNSEIYVASPATVAYSAINGVISDHSKEV
jgi:3-isopropylmalate/(R)-2-methylmalate dehydratase large subunit